MRLIGIWLSLCALGALAACAPHEDRPAIRIAGSSTVFPFLADVAERYSDATDVPIIIESIGSGAGHKLFCRDTGRDALDIVNSSRAQKRSERELCARNGIEDIVELRIGYDGLVVAHAASGPAYAFTLEHLYMGLARDVPTTEGAECAFQPNPAEFWSDISDALPARPIRAYGPPPTSGTRDIFVERALARGAIEHPCLRALSESDPVAFRKRAETLREDGRWVDVGENDSIILQSLTDDTDAVGVMGFALLNRQDGRLKPAALENVLPSVQTIQSGRYPLTRGLYIYVRADRADQNPHIWGMVEELTSARALSQTGYLTRKGLIQVSPTDREAMANLVAQRRVRAQDAP